MSGAADVVGAPIPELLWVERDPDRPGLRVVVVLCPLCWRVHRHSVTWREKHAARAPWCDDNAVYDIDLTGEDL